MSGWDWEYLPGPEWVVQGLAPGLREQVACTAGRLVDAAGVKYLGEPPIEESGISNVQSLGEGRWMVWYQEDWRSRKVYILRVQHLGD